jgi:bifunctional UDP-N-acetylglucosamine pyrophosphorylase/glucosamine-1-phosphate N-acetyltransferase
MVLHVVDALAELDLERVVVVVGHGAERVTKTLLEHTTAAQVVDFVEQHIQRGTGDAVAVALTAFPDDDDDFDGGDIVVLPGDTPLLRPPTLAALVRAHRQTHAAATVLTAEVADPSGYGRIVRGKDERVARIVEQADATAEQRQIREVNTGIYAFRRSVLAPALRRLSPDNAQGEYYLTDIVGVLHDAGYPVTSLVVDDSMEVAGVNDRAQLAVAEAELRDRINERWMRRGVTMLDPERTYVDTSVSLAPDVTLFPGTLLQGDTVIATGCEIGPNSHVVDSVVGERATVSNSVVRSAEIGADAVVGPYASILAGARVPPGKVTGPCYIGRSDDEEAGGP